jgi:hypothetical protein
LYSGLALRQLPDLDLARFAERHDHAAAHRFGLVVIVIAQATLAIIFSVATWLS